MINQRNLEELRHAMRTARNGLGVNMAVAHSLADSEFVDRSGHSCGTVACIGGHCAALLGHDPDSVGVRWATERWLEVDSETAEDLCFPRRQVWSQITLEEVDDVLRTLGETGRVEWRP